MEIKYPNIHVQLTGQDGNAFNLLAIVDVALRKHGVRQSRIDDFYEEATSGDYNHLLRTCMHWVNVT